MYTFLNIPVISLGRKIKSRKSIYLMFLLGAGVDSLVPGGCDVPGEEADQPDEPWGGGGQDSHDWQDRQNWYTISG